MPLGLQSWFQARGIARVVELDWWQSHQVNDRVRATYVPAEHFSGRGLFDRDKSLWGGFVLETASGRIFFAGDTAYLLREWVQSIGAYLQDFVGLSFTVSAFQGEAAVSSASAASRAARRSIRLPTWFGVMIQRSTSFW